MIKLILYHSDSSRIIECTYCSYIIILCISFVGVVGTAKAVISEISDDSTQALGVSIISTSWGLGFVIGPAVSGAISDPIGQYHLNITSK